MCWQYFIGMDYIPRIHVSMGTTDTDERAQNFGIHGIFGIQHVSQRVSNELRCRDSREKSRSGEEAIQQECLYLSCHRTEE